MAPPSRSKNKEKNRQLFMQRSNTALARVEEEKKSRERAIERTKMLEEEMKNYAATHNDDSLKKELIMFEERKALYASMMAEALKRCDDAIANNYEAKKKFEELDMRRKSHDLACSRPIFLKE